MNAILSLGNPHSTDNIIVGKWYNRSYLCVAQDDRSYCNPSLLCAIFTEDIYRKQCRGRQVHVYKKEKLAPFPSLPSSYISSPFVVDIVGCVKKRNGVVLLVTDIFENEN